MIENNKLLSVKESAELLGVNRQRVQALISQGKLPAQKIGNSYAVKKSDLEKIQTYGKAGRPKQVTNGNGQEKPFKTIFDIAPELAGSIKSGLPSDLSTNKKHLEGLGRD